MTPKEVVEKQNVQLEKAGEGSNSEAVGEALESTEKVSEIVGESASENMADGVKTKGNQTTTDEKDQKGATSSQVQPVVLPSVSVQRKKVAKVLIQERKKLLAQLNKIEKGQHFSAYKVEKLISNLRKVQRLLSEILVAAKERIEQMYKQYVLGTK